MIKKKYYRKSLNNFLQLSKFRHPEEELIAQLGRASVSLPQAFNILVWNVFKCCGGHLFYQEIEKIIADCDIICLQEVLQKKNPLVGEWHKNYNFFYAPSYTRKDGVSDGVLTASVHEMHESAIRIQSVGREPFVKTPKVALISFLPIASGETIAVVNLHAILFNRSRSSEIEFRNIVNQLVDHQGPAIIAGDFNTITRGHFSSAERVLAQHGFQHIVIPSDPRPRLRRLDHLFTRGLATESVRVLNDYHSSDHKPLVARLRLTL